MTNPSNTNLRLDATYLLSTTDAVVTAGDSISNATNLQYETTTPRVSADWYTAGAVSANSLVVSSSFLSFFGAWQPTLSADYQELADALVEMSEPEADEWAIDEPVYNVAHFVATSLLNCSYPAPKVFSHGPKSVVFNWLNGGDNLYLTVSASRVAALVSSPERIKRRFEVSTSALSDPSRLLPALKSVQVNGPVVTTDGSLDLFLKYIP
jgi:hypothetical protein